VRWSLLLLVPACGFSARTGATADAPGQADARPTDAATDAPAVTCMDHWMSHDVRFQTPTTLLELDTPDYERDPYLTPDELRIYFSAVRTDSQPANAQDIYTANRSETSEPFGPATKFTAASTTTGAEGKMSMTGDGTQLFVASDFTGGGSKGSVDVFFAGYNGTTWTTLGQGKAGAINDAGGQYDPAVSEDGTALYFAPSNGIPQQIFVAKRTDETKNFDAGTELMELVDPDGTGTADPAISADQRLIIVTSYRTGTTGANDLFYATRASTSVPFGALRPVPDVNSTTYEGDAHISHDGCRLYFASTRNNDQAYDWDLFVATQQL
jgi:Tol biopolymer transport system component